MITVGQCGTQGCTVASMGGNMEPYAIQAFHHWEDDLALRQLSQISDEDEVLESVIYL